MKRYFAYGSNMSEEQMAEPERAPDAKKIGVAVLSNYEFFINARGVASISEKPSKFVQGIVYEISETDEKKLDKREGVPKYYTKQDILALDAFTYVATDNTNNPRSPQKQKEYLEKIIEVAENNPFTSEYKEELHGWYKRVAKLQPLK
ncbi:MAG TPA: gamma-glutamylcyclotransferase family protein [Candidatus Paceibacterota bacterium]